MDNCANNLSSQNMAAVTIKQSFRTALPSYQNPIGVGDTHISGSTTLNTDPPRFFVGVSHEAWENAMWHLSEGDVVRAAAMYLLHPINQALSAIPDFASSIRCLSEQTTNGVRGDIAFNRLRSNERRCFAVVEFKKRGIIDDNEFRRAARTITRTSVAQHVQDAMNMRERTFFQDNSVKLMKQAAAYAIRNRTRYVALFNWDHLVLIRFLGLDPRLSLKTLIGNGVGDYCEISMIKYDTGSHIMRAALLGFLVEAYQQTPW
ncbi:hypothetical protein CHU98_g12149 [Xylaria longipes]|nr:hypothetical protein CHU98_g12149 [Xylaria longipes]